MLIIPCEVETITSRKDHSWKIVLGTSELSPDHVGELSRCQNKAIYCALREDPFREEEKNLVESIESEFDDQRKTQSQRIRNVLYKLFQQDSQGFKAYSDYYHFHTDKIIEHFKSKIL